MFLCGITNFHRFMLGFDRTFWIGHMAKPSQAKVYEVALASQQAALDAMRPGVTAESVQAAYAAVIQNAGFEIPFRCGRATGFNFLEAPQLVTGDKTIPQPGCFTTPALTTTPPSSIICRVRLRRSTCQLRISRRVRDAWFR